MGAPSVPKLARATALAVALSFSLASLGPHARAGDPPGAETLFGKAKAAMAEQRYADAAELFHAAFELDPAPELLWNEARARHLAGELEKARALYKDFIQRDDAPAELRGRANDAIVQITLELEKPPETDGPVTHDDTFGTVMVITGGVLVVGGAVSHIMSFAAADDMSTFATPVEGESEADTKARRGKYDDAKSTRDTTQALAIVGYALGGAALVTGIVSLILSDDPELPADTTSRVLIQPWWAPGSSGVNARISF